MIMVNFSKALFWISTIILVFVNPLISFGLLLVYYLPSIIQDSIKQANQMTSEQYEWEYQKLKKRYQNEFRNNFSKYYSNDTLKKFK
jgi:hypothetical protein